MNIISRIMGVDKTPEDKYKYIWFTMGTACFALATLVMTIVISRFLGEAKAGMFSKLENIRLLMLRMSILLDIISL